MRASFRLRLAARFTLAMAAGVAALSILTYLAIRATLDRQLGASLLNVASIQAASVTSATSGDMQLHEWDLTPEEAAQVRELNRYVQVWTAGGQSLLRTRYITADLPLDTSALRRAAGGRLATAEQEFQGVPVRALYYPLGRLGPAHKPHVLQVAAPLEARNRTLSRVVLLLGGIFLVVCGWALVGSWWLAGSAVRPIDEIIDQAEGVEAGTLERRIGTYADTREYQRLVQVLNTMLARLDDAFRAQRQFTADASHELRSPLTALQGELELARRRRRTTAEYERVIDSSLEEVGRLARIVEDLLTLTRSDGGALEPDLQEVALVACASSVVQRLRCTAGRAGVRLVVDGPAEVRAHADPDLLPRLLWNLISNAIRFSPPGGVVALRISQEHGAPVLEVCDEGPGIPPEALDRIFDRFYQVDPSRTPDRRSAGTGLGLAIVRAIADVHGATVSAANRPGGGACFRVILPPTGRPDGPRPPTRRTPAGGTLAWVY